MDFMRGAALAPHGRPILALPATARAPKTRVGYRRMRSRRPMSRSRAL